MAFDQHLVGRQRQARAAQRRDGQGGRQFGQ
jgi:hypothetical protein